MVDDEVRSYVRTEFYDVRSRFLDRLSCARFFDRERFDALLLWLDTLRGSCAAANLSMLASDFDQFRSIASYLEQEATHSRDQRPECAAAYSQWIGIMRQFHLLQEEKPEAPFPSTINERPSTK